MPDLLDELKALTHRWRDAIVNYASEHEVDAIGSCIDQLTALIARHESRPRQIPAQADDTYGPISHDEAMEIAHRFIAFRFGNVDATGREIVPQASIPADPKHDDDLRLCEYLRRQKRSHESRGKVVLLGPYLYDGTWKHLDGDALGLENAIDDALEGKIGRYRVTVEEVDT